MRVGTAAPENLLCFQIDEPNADSRSISGRSFYDLHLLIRWAQAMLILDGEELVAVTAG
jgi:hypothetical protein